MEHSPSHKRPQSQQEAGLSSLLRNDPPRRMRLWWLLPAVLAVVAFRLYLSFADAEPSRKVRGPVHYKVTDDLETLRRQRAIEQMRKEEELQKAGQAPLAPVAAGRVRVAAAQIESVIGNSDKNRRKMEAYLRKAAENGVRLVIFPEAALPGYADPENLVFWATDPQKAAAAERAEEFLPVAQAAEEPQGQEVTFFRKLASELKLYIALPFIEQAGGRYYSALLLLDDQGRTLLTRRKTRLWALGDRDWATAATEPVQSVQTPFGRVGLVLSYDMTADFPELRKQGATLILHSAAFYGENMQRWTDTRYRKLVESTGAAVVLANWGRVAPAAWEGFGVSRVYAPGGVLLAGQGEQEGETLVIADLPLPGFSLPPTSQPAGQPAAKPDSSVPATGAAAGTDVK